MKRNVFLFSLIVFIIALTSTLLLSCELKSTDSTESGTPEDIEISHAAPGEDMYAISDNELPPESFIGTVIEEDTHYMIVEPNIDEEEYDISRKIRVEYLHDHLDYLYGTGRKVLITYIPPLSENKAITTDLIGVNGFEEFELSVQYAGDNLPAYASSPAPESYVKLVANNSLLYPGEPDFNIYYIGLSDVYVTADGTTLPLYEALVYGKITPDGLISECNRLSSLGKIKSEVYKDGGSVLYDFGDFRIIKCHTLDGNRDIFIGTNALSADAHNLLGLCITGYEWRDFGLRLTAKDVSADGASIIFTQKGEMPTGSLQTGDAFYLERKDGSRWISVSTLQTIDFIFYDIAYEIKQNGKTELLTEWKSKYDSLPQGQYRIKKQVTDFRDTGDFDTQYFYAYFDITAN